MSSLITELSSASSVASFISSLVLSEITCSSSLLLLLFSISNSFESKSSWDWRLICESSISLSFSLSESASITSILNFWKTEGS